MSGEHYIERLLEDEGLVGALDDTEASLLIETLTARALNACKRAASDADAESAISAIRRYGRGVSRVVSTWRDEGAAKAAEVARQNQLPWPPTLANAPGDVLQWLLDQPGS